MSRKPLTVAMEATVRARLGWRKGPAGPWDGPMTTEGDVVMERTQMKIEGTVMTKEEAIAKLVELDVEKWGESERNACKEIYSRSTHGLLLNDIASRAELAGDMATAKRLYKESDTVLTRSDRRVLRNGG